MLPSEKFIFLTEILTYENVLRSFKTCVFQRLPKSIKKKADHSSLWSKLDYVSNEEKKTVRYDELISLTGQH